MDRWTDGPMDRWTDGPMDRWTDGPMDRWTDGPMDRWTDGPMDRSVLRSIRLTVFSRRPNIRGCIVPRRKRGSSFPVRGTDGRDSSRRERQAGLGPQGIQAEDRQGRNSQGPPEEAVLREAE